MDTKVLEKIGLTKNEIAVYLALLELGTTSTGPMIVKSGLHSSRVYESLNSLIKKGMVSFVLKGNVKEFTAAEPESILDLLEERKRDVQDIIPELKVLKSLKKPEDKATVYEGYRGVRSVYDDIVRSLKKNDEILVFGARGQDESFMSKTFFKQYTSRRVAKGIKMRIIFNDDAKETGKYYSKLPNTTVKYMPKNMKTPAAVDIFSNNVGILVLKPTPKIFLITSKEVADSYRAFFDMLWQLAR